MDEQNIQSQQTAPAPDPQQSQTFQVKVNADGGATIDDPQSQTDYRNNPDYVPDDPPNYDSTAPEGKPDNYQEPTPQKEADIQQQFEANNTDIETAAQFIESKGLSYEKIVTEFAQNGRLSDDSYAKLKEAGIPRSMVDSYCAGQEALYAAWVNHVQGIAGGEKQYGELMRYASTHLSDREKDAYDEAVNSGDFSRAKSAVQALMYQFEKANPNDGYQYEGNNYGKSTPIEGFRTPEEAYAMEEDPRMYTDPQFQRLFQMRLQKTAFLQD